VTSKNEVHSGDCRAWVAEPHFLRCQSVGLNFACKTNKNISRPSIFCLPARVSWNSCHYCTYDV